MGGGLLPFVHPGLAGAAVIAASIPVLIHLINRRRYRRVPWAAMRFLEAAAQRSTRRLRLEQLTLLAARVGLVALLGMALARPFVPAAGWLPLESTGIHRIILLDNSLSMSAKRPDGRARLEAGREIAATLINGFPQSDPISLVTLSSPATRRIGQASYDRRLVREQVAAVAPTHRATDFTGGLAAALELVRESPTAEGNRAVYIISDFPAAALLRQHTLKPEPGGTAAGVLNEAGEALRRMVAALPDPAHQLILIPVDQTAGNAAVVELTADARLISRDVPVRISATIANFGDTPLRSASVSFLHGGRVFRREPVPTVEPGAEAIVGASLILSDAGTQAVTAQLNADRGNALIEDDSRYLSIDVRENRRVLLVDGRPGAGKLDGQAGFLAAALSPESLLVGGHSRSVAPSTLITPKTILPAEISSEPLNTADIIALCGAPRLSPEEWGRLGEFVRSGGGLFVFLGDGVSIENYNRFGHAAGEGVLPAKLEQVVDVATLPEFAAGDTPFGFRADEFDTMHPAVAEFRGRPTSGLFAARVQKYMRVSADQARAQVALHYSNGDPAMIASDQGSGRVLVFTTTANMDWNNLPARGDYVSLMLGAVAYLASGREQGGRYMVGQPVRVVLDPSQVAAQGRVSSPDGALLSSSIVPQGEGLALQTEPVERSGFVTLELGGPSRQIAVNVDTAESDLVRFEPLPLTSSLGIPLRWVEQEQLGDLNASVKQSAELGGYALYAATLLLLCELWLGMHFASRQGGSA